MAGFEPADLFLGQEALFLLSYIRVEPSAGFAPAPRDWATRTLEPPSGADPDRPPYEGGAAAVRGGVAARRGFEPRPSAPRTRRPASWTSGHRYGRRESNAHAAGFEPARSASCLTPAWCAARGSNPVSLD